MGRGSAKLQGRRLVNAFVGLTALALGAAAAPVVVAQDGDGGPDCPPTATTGPPPTEPGNGGDALSDVSVAQADSDCPETQPPARSAPVVPPPPPPLPSPTIECQDGVDPGDLAPPVTGELINVIWISGEPVNIETPDGGTICLTGGAVQIPVGSVIDARDSKVQVITEGSERESDFFDGLFQVLQADEPHAITVLKLIGALEHCDTTSADKPGGRQLWGDGEGMHRTEGSLAAATVRGTRWLLQDRCNGTTFAKVVEGVVTLIDRAKNKTIELQAGESYIARPEG